MRDLIRVQTRIPRLIADMNRPSVYIKLEDEEFMARFRELWSEHIEGFVGLSRGNTNKKKMEWQVRLEEKQQKQAREGASMKRQRSEERDEVAESDDAAHKGSNSQKKIKHEQERIVDNSLMEKEKNKNKKKSAQVVSDSERSLAILRYRQMMEQRKAASTKKPAF